MFAALRASRSLPLPATRALSSRLYSQKPSSNVDDLVDLLVTEANSPDPPKPPANAYPPPKPPPSAKGNNPFRDSADSRINEIIRLPNMYHLHCHSSRNNTITTFTRPNGTPIAWFSGGSCGFKKGNRASYEAGYQCAVRMFERIEKEVESNGKLELQLVFKGFGQGRDALHRAIMTTEGEFVRPLVKTIVDKTPIKIGGTRSPKARRL